MEDTQLRFVQASELYLEHAEDDLIIRQAVAFQGSSSYVFYRLAMKSSRSVHETGEGFVACSGEKSRI